MTRQKMIAAVEHLETGKSFVVPESDYGKAEIWRVNDIFLLFEIPMYGGEPYFHTYYPVAGGAAPIIDFVLSWT